MAAIFAFVPVIGLFVLWLPAAVYLTLEGRWGEALGVAALGTVLVRTLEDFLYPVLVQHRARVPSERIFIALIGGLILFGWSGLVILTVTCTLAEVCSRKLGSAEIEGSAANPS